MGKPMNQLHNQKSYDPGTDGIKPRGDLGDSKKNNKTTTGSFLGDAPIYREKVLRITA